MHLFGLIYGDFNKCGGKVFNLPVNISVIYVCLLLNDFCELFVQ